MPQTELHNLAQDNEINQLNIKFHVEDVNTVCKHNYYYDKTNICCDITPLHVALLNGNRKSVLFLIASGADINIEFSFTTGDSVW